MLHLALKESERASVPFQHGAVIVKGNRVMSRGHNSFKTHPVWGTFKTHSGNGTTICSIHAEAAAIRQALTRGTNLKGATIYVARRGRRMSKPCVSCQKLIERYGISKVVYTGRNGETITEWPL